MRKPKNYSYKVTEGDILKISKLMGCLEETIKEIIRVKHPLAEDIGVNELYFYEMNSRALVELETDNELKHYFDLEK